MDEAIAKLIEYGLAGVVAAIFLLLFLKEKKEHREDLLRILPLIEYMKEFVKK